MTPDDIRRLVRRVRATGLAACEVELEGAVLRLRWGRAGPAPAPVPMSEAMPATSPEGVVRAPAAGVFFHRHPLTGERHRPNGAADTVDVGFLQVGQALIGIRASSAHAASAPAVADGTLVGYGQILYALD